MKSLDTIQENIWSAAKEIAQTTQEDRSSFKKRVPLNVTVEEAAASQMLAYNERKCSGVSKKGPSGTPRQVQPHAGEKEDEE